MTDPKKASELFGKPRSGDDVVFDGLGSLLPDFQMKELGKLFGLSNLQGNSTARDGNVESVQGPSEPKEPPLAMMSAVVVAQIERAEKMLALYEKRVDAFVRDESRSVGLGWGRVGNDWGLIYHSYESVERPKIEEPKPHKPSYAGNEWGGLLKHLMAVIPHSEWKTQPLKDVSVAKKADAITLLPALIVKMDAEYERRVDQYERAILAISSARLHVRGIKPLSDSSTPKQTDTLAVPPDAISANHVLLPEEKLANGSAGDVRPNDIKKSSKGSTVKREQKEGR